MAGSSLEQKSFLMLLMAVSTAFVLIVLPFYGAVFWAVILAILFAPLQRLLGRWLPRWPNLTALATLLTCLLVAVLPTAIAADLLVKEAADLFRRVQGGELDIGVYVDRARELLPEGLRRQLFQLGLGDVESLRARLSEGALQLSNLIAGKAVSFGQGTFEWLISFFAMIYLLFFFLRDGVALVRIIRRAIPLDEEQKSRLFEKFVQVVRATVKGNIVIAATQGLLGAIMFAILDIPAALLWGVVMALLSLLPAVGAGLVWGPVALYLLAGGALVSGVVLTFYGVLVIGLVDNLLRPVLVGKDTRMPDYLVLITTLGGLALFGLNGFVIGPLVGALFIAAWTLFAGPDEDVSEPD